MALQLTPARMRASYSRMMGSAGTEASIMIRRITNPTTRAFTDYPTRARLHGYSDNELIGQVSQGDIKAIILAEDLDTASFPHPMRKGDQLIANGKIYNVEVADGTTRRIQGVLMAYEARIRG